MGIRSHAHPPITELRSETVWKEHYPNSGRRVKNFGEESSTADNAGTTDFADFATPRIRNEFEQEQTERTESIHNHSPFPPLSHVQIFGCQDSLLQLLPSISAPMRAMRG